MGKTRSRGESHAATSGAAVGKISRGNGGGVCGGAATAMESAVAKTSQARRRRSQARVREGGRQREEKRCGILQRKQQGNVGRSSSSSALWLSEDKGRNEDVPCVVERRRKTGKLGSTNHARQCYQPPCQHEITAVKGKMKLRWETKIPNRLHEGNFEENRMACSSDFKFQ